MNELKPKDVMRALECCTNKQRCDCDNCPYVNRYHCTNVVMQDALALLCEKDAEIETLGAELSRYTENVAEMVETARAEAVSEFAYMLCEGRVANDPVVIAVRCAEKEMKVEQQLT